MITSPSGRIYIGCSVDINVRWANYRSVSCKKQHRLHASFLKYGVKAHNFQIICECEESQLDYLEGYLIRFYDTYNTRHGLNLKEGGSHARLSEETKEKIRKKHIGKKYATSTIELYRKRMKGNKINLGRIPSQETRDRMSKAHTGRTCFWKGKKLTREHSNNISKSLAGKKRRKKTEKEILCMRNNSKDNKPVIQMDKNLFFINEYISIKDASRHCNIRSSGISRCCLLKRKTAGGFMWKFK